MLSQGTNSEFEVVFELVDELEHRRVFGAKLIDAARKSGCLRNDLLKKRAVALLRFEMPLE